MSMLSKALIVPAMALGGAVMQAPPSEHLIGSTAMPSHGQLAEQVGAQGLQVAWPASRPAGDEQPPVTTTANESVLAEWLQRHRELSRVGGASGIARAFVLPDGGGTEWTHHVPSTDLAQRPKLVPETPIDPPEVH